MLNDFVTSAKVDENGIRKYNGKIPAELMDIWKEYGFGSFFGGYLKVINPDDYMDIVKDSYFRGNVSIPILGTAFGDIFLHWRSMLRLLRNMVNLPMMYVWLCPSSCTWRKRGCGAFEKSKNERTYRRNHPANRRCMMHVLYL